MFRETDVKSIAGQAITQMHRKVNEVVKEDLGVHEKLLSKCIARSSRHAWVSAQDTRDDMRHRIYSLDLRG